jgi:4-amino-4-deoxy-L-arabinose transferase-like glycosyltransferase
MRPAHTPTLRRDLGLLLVLLLPFFLLMTGARPLNIPDEGRYPEVAREMLLSGDFVTPRNNGVVFLDKPALYYWLQALAMALFGVEVWSIRLMPALFGVAGCLVTFACTRALYSRRAAWLAALVLACQPLYWISSQYADMNTEVGVWIAVSLLALLMADHRAGGARQGWLFLAYFSAGCAFLTKGLIGLVFPLMIVGAWLLWRRRWRELPRYGLPWGLALIVAINLPWYALVQRANPDFLHYFFVYQQLDRYAATGFNNAQPWWYYPAILAGGLLPWSVLLPRATAYLWQRWRAEGEDGRRHLYLLLWPWLILLFFSLPESKISSYLIPAMPGFAIALGVYMDTLLRRRERPREMLLMPLISLALGGGTLVATLNWAGPPAARLLAAGIALLWLACGAAAGWWLHRGRVLPAWEASAAAAALGLMLIVPLVPYFTQYSSSRPLAEALRPHLDSDTPLISYRSYLNDLPLYLQQRQPVIVVDRWDDPSLMARDNWRREFYIGLQQDATARAWLKTERELPALLARREPYFLLVRYPELAHIRALRPGLHEWGRFDRVVLLSNHPPRLKQGARP